MAVMATMEMVEMEIVEMEMCRNRNQKEGEGIDKMLEKRETIFHISNCPKNSQVNMLLHLVDSALTWWNSHKRTIRTEAAFAMSWRELMKLMTKVYCLRNEFQKMETKLWNLTVKNNDLTTYTQRFQELTMMCTKMVPEEEDRVEKFIGGRKRRLDNNYRGNRGQQPPHKRQNTGGHYVARAYTAGNNEKNGYEGTLPFCNKWPNEGVITCFECGAQGHYRKDCPKVKNQNRGNKARRDPDSKSTLLDIIPSALDVSYAVELADERTSETNNVLRGCTLGLFRHPFNIDLMPIDLGSLDVIIGMDWLAKNHAVIVCDEKIV
ncbi:reverse transcriptase domain-containing protein [Tanacetum coccineum]